MALKKCVLYHNHNILGIGGIKGTLNTSREKQNCKWHEIAKILNDKQWKSI